MRQWRITPSLLVLMALVVAMLWPIVRATADETGSGTITVQIVPPGSITPTPVVVESSSAGAPAPPQLPAPASIPMPGTLSAFIIWLPDPTQGEVHMHSLIAVQDHRAEASGWTLRLMMAGTPPAYVQQVIAAGAGFGIPAWLYTGIFSWDVAVGATLGESPQIVTAPPMHGYSLTIHQVWLHTDSGALGLNKTVHTLMLFLPFAP